MKGRVTVKDKILKLLKNGTPMPSMEIADKLNITKAAASDGAKELHRDRLIHIVGWRLNTKNGGSKVYAFGYGNDFEKPEPRNKPRNKESVLALPKVFIPHADIAAAWLRNSVSGDNS